MKGPLGRVEATDSLLTVIHRKGVHNLTLDEANLAYQSKTLPDQWHRISQQPEGEPKSKRAVCWAST
eukprot:5392194-Amphidinium_carterae.1